MTKDRFDFVIENMEKFLRAASIPTVTRWERVDGQPRTHELTRAMRAEVRDPLWMLSRQWQLGELEGDDAGSPVLAKLQLGKSRMTQYRARGAEAVALDDRVPLEAQAEQRPVQFGSPAQPLSLDLRLAMGRHWLKLLARDASLNATYRASFRSTYMVPVPVPDTERQAAVLAHRESFQAQAALGGRAMDGWPWCQWLRATGTRDWTTLPATLRIEPSDQSAISALGGAFVAWFNKLITQPATPDDSAWDAQRLAYRFAGTAPEAGGLSTLQARAYPGGSLDWHAFDRERSATVPPTEEPALPEAKTFIPTAVEFSGMANTRWWSFEDRRVSFAGIQPDTTDLAKLLLLEFGLVYANDWCVVPVPLQSGDLVDVQGLAVTNVFGERLWIEAASRTLPHAGQRWRMFELAASDGSSQPGLCMLSTVPKVQSGPPIEAVTILRDEMANYVWAVENTIPLPTGQGREGSLAAAETAAFHQRLHAGVASSPTLVNDAKIRYSLMTTVPENWIPFMPIQVEAGGRRLQLQRGSMLRILENDSERPRPIKPRTSLLREGLDGDQRSQPYFLDEEEVPREGIHIEQCYQRTRWADGRAVVWLGATRKVGRGEGASGLEFDLLRPIEGR